MDVLRVILAIFLPPVAVFLTVGLGAAFWINILLTILGFGLGGVIHALWVLVKVGRQEGPQWSAKVQ
ncbi:MAG: YqaE/Pmp3 family membrane protein [Fimbriimonadaceae bacterium]|nr:YqaE/Pmp3 family membrane protein [Fimbriimonadaceae bacterium]